MSIRKMTFSLASLILIMAFGMVFAPISVMAHAPVSNGADPPADTLNHPDGLTQGAHQHPPITVTITDSDPRIGGIQILDTDQDTESGLTPTIQFDVTITVPVGAQDNGSPVAAATFTATPEVAVTAYDRNFLPVGASIGFGSWAQADTTGAPREWTSTVLLTLEDTTLPGTETGPDAETAARNAAKAAAIQAGLTVSVVVPDDLIQTTSLVGGPMEGQRSLESTITATIVGEASQPPPVLVVCHI